MMNTKKNLCYIFVALIIFAFFSLGSGCGDTKYYYGNDPNSSSSSGTNDDGSGNESSGTAANIDGTYRFSSEDGRTVTGTYVQGSIDVFQISVKKSTLGYAIILTGKNIFMSGTEVAMLEPTYKDNNNDTFEGTFITMPMFTYDGKNSYVIDGTTDEQAKLNIGLSKITITLESNSTLRWTYWVQGDSDTIGGHEVYQEIILRRVK